MTKSLCDSCVDKNCLWRVETKSYDPPVMNCRGFKKAVTNADKIRSMTDEELAKVLHCQRTQSPYVVGNDSCETTNCIDCTLAWLRQEANND